MKKIVSILLLILLMFSLSACKKENTTSSKLDTNVQSDISSIGDSTENTTTSEEISTSTSSTNTTTSNTIPSNSTPSNSTPSNSTPSNSTPSNTEEPKPTVVAGEYTVTFDYGYANIKTTAKSKNYKVAKPDEPIRSGYKFMGWYVANEGEQWNFTGHAVTTDMTLIAKWGKYGYYISYSTIVNGIETIVLKEKIGISPDVASSGTDTTTYERGVYASFSTYSVAIGGDSIINPKVIMHQARSGYDSYSFKVPSCFTVDSETFTVPELTFDNLEFLGWTYDGQSTPLKTVTIPKGTTKDYKLVANWKSK